MMQTIDEARTALWGQLIDSGELSEVEANTLLDGFVSAIRGDERARLRELAELIEPAYIGDSNDYEFDTPLGSEENIWVLPQSALEEAHD
jgi:hypothetical protein